MGHWTESCSFTGLPIEEWESVYRVEVRKKPWSYFGVLSLQQVMRDYIERLKHIEELKTDILLNCPNKAEYHSWLPAPYPPVTVHFGEYDGYGGLAGMEASQTSQDSFREGNVLFIHTDFWDFCVASTPKTSQSICEAEVMFGGLMCVLDVAQVLRLDCRWSDKLIGPQSVELSELELRQKYISMLQDSNTKRTVEYYEYWEGCESE